MRPPRDVRGVELERAPRRIGYRAGRRRGSHARTTTRVSGGHHEVIPRHNPVEAGTPAGVLRSVASHHGLTVEELLDRLDPRPTPRPDLRPRRPNRRRNEPPGLSREGRRAPPVGARRRSKPGSTVGVGVSGAGMRGGARLIWENGRCKERLSSRTRRHFELNEGRGGPGGPVPRREAGGPRSRPAAVESGPRCWWSGVVERPDGSIPRRGRGRVAPQRPRPARGAPRSRSAARSATRSASWTGTGLTPSASNTPHASGNAGASWSCRGGM